MRLIWIGLVLCLPSCLSSESPVTCGSIRMQPCKDGHCIATSFFCNGENDCGDWSDEYNCTRFDSDGAMKFCPADNFPCGGYGHPCIPLGWVCDGTSDCEDGRDEINCTTTHECTSGFQCGSQCILNEWVCDGTQDCADGSDEKDCGPDGYLNHACYPEHGWFNCTSKGSQKCMPINRVCDGYVDCDDRSDEGGQCNTTANCSTLLHCEHKCIMMPTGPACTCDQGFRLDGHSCIDIDECAFSPPLCSQLCKNLHGSFECGCLTDYTLNKRNNRTCIANGPELTLFFTTDRDIRSINFPSREYKPVYPGVSEVHGITGYIEDGFIYWNEKHRDRAGIFKSLDDGSNHQLVVSAGIETVEDMEIDWVGRHIYFTDSGRKHIVACDVYGALCTVVISERLDRPHAIALYPEKRLLFWSDCGAPAHIGSAGMDGSNRKNIVTNDIVWPSALVVDETVQRIFWSDPQLGRIESARFDGTQRSVLPVSVKHPFAIEIFEDTLYWIDRHEHEVLSCSKHSGKDRKVLMKEAKLTPQGIYAHHPAKQRHVPNPCVSVACSHLCLLSPNSDGFQCACPIGTTLNANNRTCDTDSAEESSLIIATFTELYQLTHHRIGKDSVVRLPTRIMENIGALAFNPIDHSIIYSDLGKKVIYSMHLGTRHEKVLFEDAEGVEGIAVDPYTSNIYWTEVSQGNLVVGHIKMDGQEERVVLARELQNPKSIVLAPERGLMFVTEGRQNHTISVWHMDGTSRQELVKAYGSVTAMAFEDDFLYFTDSVRGTIEKISALGHRREILRSHLNRPVAIDASGGLVFWMTLSSPRVNWLDTREPKTTRGFVIEASEESSQYHILKVVDKHDFNGDHVCLGHTGGCSDICAPTPSGAKCLCSIDKVLAEDQHVCIPLSCSEGETFKCQSKCVPLFARCNGFKDCPLGEDEIGCYNSTTASPTCSPDYFQCKNGACVPASFKCDGDSDCTDGSDEPDTCPRHECGEGDYSCPNERHCIPLIAKCDGQKDCKDGSDEANCTSITGCRSTQFFCEKSGFCIPETWVCDKSPDCEHAEDEDSAFCTSHSASAKCPPKFVRCPGQIDCIPKSLLCRNERDCALKTEKELCAQLNEVPTEVIVAKKSCDDDEFMCYMGSNDCIPLSAKCNCKFECRFGEDEEDCPPCEEGLFRCPQEMKYINQTWVCDGFPDCSDGTDERPELCQVTTQAPSARGIFELCKPDEFECLNGQCIPFSLTCDEVPHCTDGTDEGGKCITSCALDNGNCSQMCKPSPSGPICECGPGYESEFDGHTCSDIDECESEENPCSQFCSNTKGSYKCSCAPGYKLEYDHHTCKLVSGRPMILASGPSQVELLLNMYEPFGRQLITSEAPIKDVVYNGDLSTLYWVTSAGISRRNSHGAKLIYPMSGLLPSAIALDRATGNIYVSALANNTEGQDRSIIKIISSPSNAVVIMLTTSTIITDLVIDSEAGVLFWSDHSKPDTGRIVRAAMDGSSTTWLMSLKKVQYPVALTLDTVQRRVYWADLKQHTISSCGYDGEKQKVVVSNTRSAPLSITFFEGRISWTAHGHNVIYSQMVYNGTLFKHEMNGATTQIAAIHPLLQPAVPNPCASSPCNNGICVLKSNVSFSCFCPQEVAILSSNPFRCSESSEILGEDSYDAEEITSSPGVTVATILVCLLVLIMLGVVGCVYYRRWHRSVGTPLKFRFRSALGLSGESTAWEESVDYSDRKRLYQSDDLDDSQSHVDHNENRRSSSTAIRIQSDSAYASQQSLAKPRLLSYGGEREPQQLLPDSYSMKDQLLASEL